jgi:tetratricopeptide (TPR) repeat protein
VAADESAMPWAMVSPRLLRLGVLVLAVLVFLPTLAFGFVYDDHWTILSNGFLRCPQDLAILFDRRAVEMHVPDPARPVAVIFDMLAYQVFGAHAHWHHALSIALHVLVCALLWSWLARLAVPLPLVVGTTALFAVLGIHAEAVAVVSYREDLLAAALALVAALAAERALHSSAGARWLVATAALQALACAAKTSAVPMPLVWIAAHRLLPWRPWPGRRAWIVAAALALGTAATLAHQAHLFGGISPYARETGIHAAAWETSGVLAYSVQIHLAYLQQLIVPVGLSPEYVDRTAAWSDPATALGAAGLALALAWAGVSAARKRHGLAAFVVIATALLWLPTANLVPMPNMRADRFAYLASIPVCLGLAAVLMEVGARLPGRAWMRVAPLVAAIVVHGALLQAGTATYRSDGRLWEIALRRAPDSARAHALVGELSIAALRADDLRGADPALLARAHAHCRRALALGPDDALPHLCAARLANHEKRWTEAEQHFEHALARARAREDRILAALASATLDAPGRPYTERKQRALALLDRGLREFPYASEMAAAAGRIVHRLGDPARALELYRRARTLRPERWDVVLWGLELALDLGHSSAARAIWESAEDLLPDADPREVDAARRRMLDAERLFPTPIATDALPLGDLADDP